MPETNAAAAAGYCEPFYAKQASPTERGCCGLSRLAADGYPTLDDPRHTGDGYYERVVLDPDGNRTELTV